MNSHNVKTEITNMKKILKTVLSVAVATLAVACAKEKPISPETPEKINVSIDGLMGSYSESDLTKGEIQTVARLMWNEGDKVYAYDGTTYLGELTASIKETDGTYAKLSGNITAPSGEKPITLVCSPLFAGQPTVTDGKISLDFSKQTDAKVPFFVYSALPAGTTKEKLSNNFVAKFAIATSIYKCNIAGLPKKDDSIREIRVSNVNTKCNLQLSDSEAPVVTGSDSGVISRTAGITAADQRAIVTVALVPSPAASERTIDVFKDYVYGANFSKSEIASAQSYNAVFAFDGNPYYIENNANLGKSIAVLGDWNADGTQTILYWAPVNCGYEETGDVNTESDHRLGKLYQWGAGDSSLYIDPHVEAYVLYYDTATPSTWYNAKAFEAASKPGERWLSDRGPCPDGWRLPTLNEFKVLCASHPGTHGWVEKGTYAGNTYTGAEFFGANADKTAGKGVFFPAAGYRRWQDGNSTYFGSYGQYWSSTPVSASASDLSEDDKNEEWWKNLSEMSEDSNGTQTYVYFLEFDKWPNSGTTHLCPHAYGTRSLGYSVRCVAE